MEELNSVQKFYGGKTIFITGGSGFMGKVLLERLMYCCSHVKEIIILMRDKRNQSVKQRIEKFKELALFQIVMAEKPEMFNKITPVYGDLIEPNFGLNEENLKKVEDRTEIFFHLAASLKMEAPLRYNVLYNLVGTKTALTMAKRMKNLVHIQYLSTACCNVEPKVILEKVYELESGHDPEDLIQISKWMTDSAMEAIQKEILGPHPNTYTYTKRLAEIMVQREYGNLPLSIVRPTSVLPSYMNPIPGWVDSLNGIPGILYAAGKGVLRSMYVDPKAMCCFIPVDAAINTMIMIPKVLSEIDPSPDVPVYHLTAPEKHNHSCGEIFDIVKKLGDKYPASWPLWYPDGGLTTNWYLHTLKVFLFQLVPAYFIDFLLIVFQKKPFLVNIQKRIKVGCEVLAFCVDRPWHFSIANAESLQNHQTPEEKIMFKIDYEGNIDVGKYIENTIVGGRQYCVNDPLSTLPTARLVNKILYVLHQFCKFFFFYLVITFLLKAFGLDEIVKSAIRNFRDRF